MAADHAREVVRLAEEAGEATVQRMLAEVVSRTVEDALQAELAESRAAAAVVTAGQAVAEARVAAAEAAAAEAGAALQASSHGRLGRYNVSMFSVWRITNRKHT